MTTMYRVTDPATGQVAEEFPTATDAEILAALDRSATTFDEWSRTTVAERAALLTRVSEIYAERAEELAEVIRVEMGKSVPEGKGEVQLSSMIYRYFADNAEAFMADEPLRGPKDATAMIRRKPVGSLLGIMPWNFPYYQVARFAAPNLALGNTILLKHAPQCPRSAQIMEEIFIEAGLPAGAYINIYASNEQVADIILPDPRNHGVSLTGSERAGAAVAAEAGKNLKKVVLELGGSDPYILLDTDDVQKSAKTFFNTRMGNTGQACNSPKRMIVMDDIYDDFVSSITTEAAKKNTPAVPGEEGSRLSPLSSVAAADRFVEQVQDTVSEGATLLAGGKKYDGGGAYVEPVVLTDVQKGMRGYYEELFGPAVIGYQVSSEEEAADSPTTPRSDWGPPCSPDIAGRAVGDQIDSAWSSSTLPRHPRILPFGGSTLRRRP